MSDTPNDMEARGREKRAVLRFACNSGQLAASLQGVLDTNITLSLLDDLVISTNALDTPQALIIDAAIIPPDDFRPFIRHLRELQARGHYIPTLLITTPDKPVSPRGAFMSGITATLSPADDSQTLFSEVRQLINTTRFWKELEEDPFIKRKTDLCISSMRTSGTQAGSLIDSDDYRISPAGFSTFVSLFEKDFSLSDKDLNRIRQQRHVTLLNTCDELGIPRSYMIKRISDFTRFSLINRIVPETMLSGILPPEFCARNLVLPLKLHSDSYSLVFGNPFDWGLVASLRQLRIAKDLKHICTADPAEILFALSSRPGRSAGVMPSAEHVISKADIEKADRHDVQGLCDYLLKAAVKMRASDIHIEPKSSMTLVRFRIDGDLHDILCLDHSGQRLVSRLKLLGKIDIAEQRKPQDGSIEMTILNRRYTLRMATSPTPDGESISIRILDTDSGLQTLLELGMDEQQEKTIIKLSSRNSGMVLFVGPTGSGKTTSIYSMLAQIDCQKRSLVSVEDPVEYQIHSAIQHQVNQKAGVTFEALLKSSVRQDPDILFVGEIRDPVSAQIAMDFTSTGHLTYSSLHTINAITAIFRLERLGISRSILAECVIAIIAQKLVKRVCPECKEVGPVTVEEMAVLRRFSSSPPTVAARPKGCNFCNHTGYFGRTGVFEVINFTPAIKEMLLANATIAEIRLELKRRGEFLISRHAIKKIRQLTCSPKDVIDAVLLDEIDLESSDGSVCIDDSPPCRNIADNTSDTPARLLIIDDDPDILAILGKYLGNRGYLTDLTGDGIEALLKLGSCRYDLILSDILMPNLDGLKMLELLRLKGIQTPVVLMTAFASEERKQKAEELGAQDFILKPLNLDAVEKLIATRLSQGKTTCS